MQFEGSRGVVRIITEKRRGVFSTFTRSYAVKTCNEDLPWNAQHEAQVMEYVTRRVYPESPHFHPLYCYKEEQLYMPYIYHICSLETAIMSFPLQPVMSLIQQCLAAQQVALDRGFVHQDLHADNILVKPWHTDTLSYIFKGDHKIDIQTYGLCAHIIDYGFGFVQSQTRPTGVADAIEYGYYVDRLDYRPTLNRFLLCIHHLLKQRRFARREGNLRVVTSTLCKWVVPDRFPRLRLFPHSKLRLFTHPGWFQPFLSLCIKLPFEPVANKTTGFLAAFTEQWSRIEARISADEDEWVFGQWILQFETSETPHVKVQRWQNAIRERIQFLHLPNINVEDLVSGTMYVQASVETTLYRYMAHYGIANFHLKLQEPCYYISRLGEIAQVAGI